MKRFSMKKFFAVVLALLMIAGTFVGCTPKKPIDKLRAAIDKTIAAISEVDTPDLTATMKENSSVEIRVDMSEMSFLQLVMEEVPALDFALKLYAGKEGKDSALSASIKDGSKTLLDAYAYISEKYAALASDSLFGGKAYGIAYETMKEKYTSSIFGPGGAYDIGLDTNELFAASGMTTIDTVEMAAELLALTNKVNDKIFELIDTHLTVTEAEGSLTFGETEVKTNDITLSGGEKEWYNFLKEMVTFLRDDEDIANFINKYGEYFSAAAINFTIEGEEINYSNYQEMLDEFIAEFEYDMDDVNENEVLYLLFNISAEREEIIGFKFYTEGFTNDAGEDDNAVISLIWGPSVDEFKRASLFVEAEGETAEMDVVLDQVHVEDDMTAHLMADFKENGENLFDFDIYFEVTKDNGDIEAGITFEGTITENGETETLEYDLGCSYDKSSGEIVLSTTFADIEIGVEGILTTEGDVTTYALETVTYMGLGIPLNGVYVTYDRSAEIPTVGEYKEILDMTEDEFEEMIAEMVEAISALEGLLG